MATYEAPVPGSGSTRPNHPARDYPVPFGTDVMAAAPGRVVYAGFHWNGPGNTPPSGSVPNTRPPGGKGPYDGSYGNVVVIEHEVVNECGETKYWYTLYAHLSVINVYVGELVGQGDVLGKTGNTGAVLDEAFGGGREFHGPDSTANFGGNHLHFEVIKKGDGERISFNPNETGPHKLTYDSQFRDSKQTPDGNVPTPDSCEPEPPPPPLPPAPALPRRDPLVLDLDGNGFQTLSQDAGVRFDHDGNGFIERTGWIAGGDGFLVWDRNNDGFIDRGSEIFGDNTLLLNGSRASNGFQALAQYDGNLDGRIDANDAVWAQLGVWVDDGFDGADGDSASFFRDTEISSLSDVGIVAINLDPVAVGTTDGQGNTLLRTGSFLRTDGTTGQVAEYTFQRDTSEPVYEVLPVPADVAALPDIRGLGNVYSLRQAIMRDVSGQLKSLVESFILETNSSARSNLIQQIFFKWTNTDVIAPNSRGPFIDGRKVAALEAVYAQGLGNVGSDRAAQLNTIFLQLSEGFYAKLMAQSHLADLYENTQFKTDPLTGLHVLQDMSSVVALLQAEISANSIAGRERLSVVVAT